MRWAIPAGPYEHSKMTPLAQKNQTGSRGTSSTPSKGKDKGIAAAIEPEVGETYEQAVARRREMDNILQAFEKAKQGEAKGDLVVDALTDMKDVLALPLHPNPPSVASGDLLVDLLPHQSQGLAWMRRQEDPKLPKNESDPPVQLVKVRKGIDGKIFYFNTVKSDWIRVAGNPTELDTHRLPGVPRWRSLCLGKEVYSPTLWVSARRCKCWPSSSTRLVASLKAGTPGP